jgi:hypothetical protein
MDGQEPEIGATPPALQGGARRWHRPSAAELDFTGHRGRYQAAAEVTKARHRAVKLRQQWELSGRTWGFGWIEPPQPVGLSLGGSPCVRVLPWLDVAGFECIALKLTGEADSIPAARQLVRAPKATAEHAPAGIARLWRSFFREVLASQALRIGDARNLDVFLLS